MTAALTLLLVQGVLGALDTLYYHEYRARLPARGVHARERAKDNGGGGGAGRSDRYGGRACPEVGAAGPPDDDVRPELLLHAARDFLYALLFAALPFVAFHGAFAVALALVLLAEIVITLADFVIEDRVRAPLGGVFPGERVMHTVMAIVYGAMLAHLLPELARWFALPTALVSHAPLSRALSWTMLAMALGVLVSGARDLACALGVRAAAFPWRTENG